MAEKNTDLIKVPDGGELATQDDAAFKAATKSGDYLPRLQLLTSNSEIVKDGKDVLKKTIEVNKPLHYGGYHFYQSIFDMENQQYTILSVVSDSGLNIVYCGYLLIIVGVFTKFWIGPIINYFKQRNCDGN